MEEESNQVLTDKAVYRGLPLWLDFVLMIIVVLLAGLLLWQNWSAISSFVLNKEVEQIESIDSTSGVEGIIFLSAIELDNEDQVLNQTYYIDFSTGNPEPKLVNANEYVPYSMFLDFKDASNPTEFVLRTMSFDSTKEFVKDRIHKIDLLRGDINFFPEADNPNSRNLDWAGETDLIAYDTVDLILTGVEAAQFANYTIEIYSPVEDEVIITIPEAAQPQWSPDGKKLLYFKRDGLYMYDLRAEASIRILELSDNDPDSFIDNNSKLALSPNGRYFAWTQPAAKKVTIFDIGTWEPFSLKVFNEIDTNDQTEFYWPVFSPDSKFLAVQAIDTAENPEDRTNPRIEVRNIETGEIISTVSLIKFDFNSLFSDDWVVKTELLESLLGS